MAGIKLGSLKRGERVVADVAIMAQVGSNPAFGELSHPQSRRLSLNPRWAGQQPVAWQFPAEITGVDMATLRAGRSEGSVGVLASRSPAKGAGRVIRLGWPNAVGRPAPTAASCIGRYPTKPPAGRGNGLRRLLRQSLKQTVTATTRGTGDR